MRALGTSDNLQQSVTEQVEQLMESGGYTMSLDEESDSEDEKQAAKDGEDEQQLQQQQQPSGPREAPRSLKHKRVRQPWSAVALVLSTNFSKQYDT